MFIERGLTRLHISEIDCAFPPPALRRVIDLRYILAGQNGEPPFGYPGSFSEDTVELLKKHGYTASFGGHEGYLTSRSDRFALPRIVIHRGIHSERFRLIVSGCQL